MSVERVDAFQYFIDELQSLWEEPEPRVAIERGQASAK